MRRLTWALILLLLPGCGGGGDPGDYPDLPNLLLITLDTTRADYLGCYGSPDVRTPHIDALARDGVQFLRHVAPSQCTNPAHATILTGLYLARHRVYDNKTPLSEEAVTLAEILAARGYATLGAVSARHLNPSNSGFGQGFARFLECRKMDMPAGKRNGGFLRELGRIRHRPFFAWVHYFDPHGVYEPPRPWDRMYEGQDAFAPVPREKTMECHIDEDQTMVDPDEVIPLYKGEVSYLDDEIGEVLARLEAWGIADETLVVLLADHGESMTEHDIRFCHAGMFEQVLHVPLIMRWPGVLPAGLRVASRTGSADVLPTVLPLLGIDVPSGDLSGLDLAPAIARPDTVLHDALFSESFAGKIRAVYAGEHKLIQLYEEDWSLAGDRLYRPTADPAEAENLIAAEPGLAADLAARLDAWLARAEQLALPAVEDYQPDAETEEALRSLGYID